MNPAPYPVLEWTFSANNLRVAHFIQLHTASQRLDLYPKKTVLPENHSLSGCSTARIPSGLFYTLLSEY